MKTKQVLSVVAILLSAIFPALRLSAQDLSDNPYSTPISLQLYNETTEKVNRTSLSGVIETAGLRANEWATITLSVPSSWANSPVGVAPLDGGELYVAENLVVDSNGNASFAFKAGDTPGLYRVVLTVGDEQYEMQLYLPKPTEFSPDCVNP